MKKTLISLLASAFLLFACGNETGTTEDEVSSEAGSDSSVITVTDQNGEVEVPLNPESIVVYDFGILDTIDELGEGDRVVGAVKSSLPDYLSQYDQEDISEIGSLQEPDFEAVNALEPDLIIISGRQSDSLEELQKIAPTLLLSIDTANMWESFEANTTTIGTIFGKEEETSTLLEELTKKAAGVAEEVQAEGLTSLTVILNEGQLSAFGSGSRFAIINDVLGFESVDSEIEAAIHGQSITYEYVLEQNPDILFVVDRTAAIGGDTTNNDLLSNALIQQTDAYANDQIVFLSPDVWYLSGGGLQSVNAMIDEAAAVLPE